jgi:hypothetical protein
MYKVLPILFLLLLNNVRADIVENITKDEKQFGEWKISCQEDIMLEHIDCKISTTFYNNTSAIYVQPNNKIANQVVIMIPSAAENTMVKVKVDKNLIISSDLIDKKMEFGVVPFSPDNQKKIFRQIASGDNLYIRFTIRDLTFAGGMREVTIKKSMAEFTKLLIYYDSKIKS